MMDNTRHEKLEELLYKLRRARWLHRRASKYYQPRNNVLLALSFIVSGSISILSITNTDSSSNNNNHTKQRQYIGYAITLIGFVNGLITLISNQLDYKTKINNNNLASKAYDRLITQVSFEINFPCEVPINEFVGLVEENILKLKNELEVMTESRFEKEINRMIDNGFDISSDAGYMPKKSFFSFLNKKNNQSTLSDLDSECKTTNPIKKHQQNKKDSDFIKQYKDKIIQETILNNQCNYSHNSHNSHNSNYSDNSISNDYRTKEPKYHPHFKDQCQNTSKTYETVTKDKSTTSNININIDESQPLEPIKSYSIFNFIRSFFSSSDKTIDTQVEEQTESEVESKESSEISININHHPRLSKISEHENENENELSQSNQLSLISHESQNSNSLPRNESSRSQSSRPLPLSVFNMRKI